MAWRLSGTLQPGRNGKHRGAPIWCMARSRRPSRRVFVGSPTKIGRLGRRPLWLTCSGRPNLFVFASRLGLTHRLGRPGKKSPLVRMPRRAPSRSPDGPSAPTGSSARLPAAQARCMHIPLLPTPGDSAAQTRRCRRLGVQTWRFCRPHLEITKVPAPSPGGTGAHIRQ